MKNTYKFALVALFIVHMVLPIQTEAKVPYNTDFCQAIINESPMVLVEMKNFPECRNYWIYLNNRERYYFRNY